MVVNTVPLIAKVVRLINVASQSAYIISESRGSPSLVAYPTVISSSPLDDGAPLC